MKMKVLPQNIEIEIDPNKSVLQLCHENNIDVKSICHGVPSCAECRIKIKEGEHNVLPPSKAEINLIGSSYYIDQRRLSCQLRCFGPITIDVTEHLDRDTSQSKKLRGFRPQQQKGMGSSHAVQDILVLNEVAQAPKPAGPKPQNKNPRNNDKPKK
ncbi:MAG: 2Fe-2S iron-sulfur cluster-binding protein [Pseudobdellovibrionaceae bacterium]